MPTPASDSALDVNAERHRLQIAADQHLADARAPLALSVGTAAAVCSDLAGQLVDHELWPEDAEIVAEIRAMFMTQWGMDEQQADARMSRFNFTAALAALTADAHY